MLHGKQILGGALSRLGSDEFHAVDPRSGTELEPAFVDATSAEVDRALELAHGARRALRESSAELRARFLEEIAREIEALGDSLIERTSTETGLPPARFQMERGRTVGQLRMFAGVLRDGTWVDARFDGPDPERKPLPKPDLRRMRRAIGPVVVFGASNFPLAFSTAGGDTASAFAAGCPVVVKAHPAHPGACELVGGAIARALATCELPAGAFSLVHGTAARVGRELVEHPLCEAVGFTGSLAGGRALFDLAAARPRPIPVFAEMGSINPVFVTAAALERRGAAIAAGLHQSVLLGVGQFCTNPGVVFVPGGELADHFVGELAERFAQSEQHTMLHHGIRRAFDAASRRVAAVNGVATMARVAAPAETCTAAPAVYCTDLKQFLAEPTLREEVFGPATLIVACPSEAAMVDAARALDGQLTATLQAEPEDVAGLTDLVAALEERAGRLVFNAFPTGVEVGPAMQHGGPYPATTDARSTSVGTAAIERFVRPVCWQDFPEELLPIELRGRG